MIWHLGYTKEASAAAFTQSYGVFQRAALHQEPTYRVRGILTDGFDSTVKSMRTLFPGAPGQLSAPCDQQAPEETDGDRVPGAQGVALTISDFVVPSATAEELTGVCSGPAVTPFCRPCRPHRGGDQRQPGAPVFQDKKAGWYAVLEDPQMPATSTLLDQAHNAIERKLFAMKGFHHPGGSQQAFLTGSPIIVQSHPVSAPRPACGAVWWQWKADDYPQPTGSSICRSLPLSMSGGISMECGGILYPTKLSLDPLLL